MHVNGFNLPSRKIGSKICDRFDKRVAVHWECSNYGVDVEKGVNVGRVLPSSATYNFRLFI
jgi:hypothetical protein